MLPGPRPLVVLLTMALAAALSGCFTTPGDGVFGPASGLAALEDAAPPSVSLKVLPSRGSAPLPVAFTLNAHGLGDDVSKDDLAWALDFGDGSPPAEGIGLPATVEHTYSLLGPSVAAATVQGPSGETRTTASVVVLDVKASTAATPEPLQGPEPPPAYAPAQPQSSSSTGPTASPDAGGTNGTADGNSTGSTTTTSGKPGKDKGKQSTSSTTSTTSPPSTTTASSTSTSSAPPETRSSSTTTSQEPTSTQTSTSTSSETDTGSPSQTSDPTPSETTTDTSSPTPTSSGTSSQTSTSESTSSSQSSTDPPM